MEPDIVIDVTNFMDKKFAAIKAFESQFFNPNSNEPKTPISGEHYLDFVKSKMNVFGRSIGAQYAEGFIKSRTIGVNNLFDLI